jgi:hypothetical protein
MTKQVTLEQALKLVDFDRRTDGTWRVSVVKGDCGTVEGDCTVVKGSCSLVKGSCITIEGNCDTIEGHCGTVEGYVLGTINGREWQYAETPREKMARLLKEGASKEELLKAMEEL